MVVRANYQKVFKYLFDFDSIELIADDSKINAARHETSLSHEVYVRSQAAPCGGVQTGR